MTISERIKSLPKLSKPQLVKLWQASFSQPIPSHLRKQLIVPILAYRIQELEYGGLSHTARQRLRLLVTESDSESGPKPNARQVQSDGTRFLRSWHGEMHEVDVVDGSFAYRGQSYRSLSKIASEITGTQWSGPAFFGTKEPGK